jgi:hypothetical protein
MASLIGVLALVIWTGTAHVDVMITEPGGVHPYMTDFELEYEEAPRAPIADLTGHTVGYVSRLVPRRVAIKVHQEVRGLLNCTGEGEEVVSGAPEGRIVVPSPGRDLLDPLGVSIPSAGAYELVLPRAVAAFACGSKPNKKDRWVVIGLGLFHPAGDIDTSDRSVRAMTAAGDEMLGSFESVDPAYKGGPIRHEYKVSWHLRRRF